MLRYLVGLTAAAIVMATSVSAYALTLTNRDSAVYTMTVVDDQSVQTVTIQPDETMNDLCAQGCTITLGEADSVELDGNETVMIEGGSLTIAE
jgi:hypothetical protein